MKLEQMHQETPLENPAFVNEAQGFESEEPQRNSEGETWVGILEHRLYDPESFERYRKLKEAFPTEEKRDRKYFETPDQFRAERPIDIPADVYDAMLSKKDYEWNLKNAFARIRDTDRSTDHGKFPAELGVSGGRGTAGYIFADARIQTERPTASQRGMLESYLKAQGALAGYTNGEANFLRLAFDTKENQDKAFMKPQMGEEALVKMIGCMSLLKNYFNFKAGDVFTKKHLDIAREHFITDTKFGSVMQDFFNAIGPDNEQRVINMINTIAC